MSLIEKSYSNNSITTIVSAFSDLGASLIDGISTIDEPIQITASVPDQYTDCFASSTLTLLAPKILIKAELVPSPGYTPSNCKIDIETKREHYNWNGSNWFIDSNSTENNNPVQNQQISFVQSGTKWVWNSTNRTDHFFFLNCGPLQSGYTRTTTTLPHYYDVDYATTVTLNNGVPYTKLVTSIRAKVTVTLQKYGSLDIYLIHTSDWFQGIHRRVCEHPGSA